MIQFELPQQNDHIIKVIGVGGGGGNAVNHMFNVGIDDVNFILCNTDQKALRNSPVPSQVQLGPNLTQGLGAGAKPEVGRDAATESLDDIRNALGQNTQMVFVTAGMGGGTGTGGAPLVAELAKEMGALTVGIVTTPFSYEGARRRKYAEEGIEELKEHVDTLLVISNDKVREHFGDVPVSQAFAKADDILATATQCITGVINSEGHIGVDFADVCTVMRNGGRAILGSAKAQGENRAAEAVELALDSPLLNDRNISGAKWVLLNVNSSRGAHEHTLDEMEMIQAYVQRQAGAECDLILGMGYDEELGDQISITLIATGFQETETEGAYSIPDKDPNREVLSLTTNRVIEGEPITAKDEMNEEDAIMLEMEGSLLDEESLDLSVSAEVEPPSIPNPLAFGFGMSRRKSSSEMLEEEISEQLEEEMFFAAPLEEVEQNDQAVHIELSTDIDNEIVEEVDEHQLAYEKSQQEIEAVLANAFNGEEAEETTVSKFFVAEEVPDTEEPERVVFDFDAKKEEASADEEEIVRPWEMKAVEESEEEEKLSAADQLLMDINSDEIEREEEELTLESEIKMEQLEKSDEELENEYVTVLGITLKRKKGSRYLTDEELEQEAKFELRKRAFDERAAGLRSLSYDVQKVKNEGDEEEEVPAYIRRNKELDDYPHSSESVRSDIEITADKNQLDSNISTRNTFLNGDNPD